VTTDGEGNFGGVAGEIRTGETGQPPVQTADGAGNFGGAVGEIPASEAGQEPVTTSTTDSIAQTTEQAAPGSGQASINVGDQGAVIVSINPDGADGTLEAVSIASLASGAGAKAKARREADRAAILRQRADSDTTSTDQPAITPAPKYNPRGKRQQKSSQDAAPIFKRDRRQSLNEVSRNAPRSRTIGVRRIKSWLANTTAIALFKSVRASHLGGRTLFRLPKESIAICVSVNTIRCGMARK
jgi:hypothetical protein